MNLQGPTSDLIGPLVQQIDTLQDQLDSLNAEVEMLRRRDQTIDDYLRRVDEEMRMAARLQRDFLPRPLPQFGNIRFHTLFRPASYVSGDYYDIIRLDDEHVGFYVVDAVGHGMPAALLTIFLKQSLITREMTDGGYRLLEPGETLGRFNRLLSGQDLSYTSFLTGLYGLINIRDHSMRFASGGHPRPVIVRSDGTLEIPEADGALLGVFPEESFATTHIQLQKGDRFFVYTDGIELAFSDERGKDPTLWHAELHRRRHLNCEQLLADLSLHLDNEAGSITPKDDLTLIAVEV